jgi:hypothetical protein
MDREPDQLSTDRALTTMIVRIVLVMALPVIAVAGFALARSSWMGLLLLAVLLPSLVIGVWAVRLTRPDRPAADPEAEDPAPDWASAIERFDRLRGEYAAFETDPLQVLRLPALADVTVGSTARFVDAFAEAQSLRTEEHPDDETAARFAAAVERAEQAWHAAEDTAERIGRSALAPAERAAVERVVKLLTTARDSDSEPERVVAYARARAELARLRQAGVLDVPLPAQAALDQGARGALPAGDARPPEGVPRSGAPRPGVLPPA